MVVVFSETDAFPPTNLNTHELHAITETARMFGCRIHPIPQDFNVIGRVENALTYLPTYDSPIPGVWVGYIPSVERYRDLYDGAKAKGIYLLNTPIEHQIAMEFDRFYPRLGQLTPESTTITSVDACENISAQLGFPVFVKGTVKSNKSQGWNACVAHNETELVGLVNKLLTRTNHSRGRVIVRKLAKLRYVNKTTDGFPLGREYRVFVYKNDVLAFGYYWDEQQDAYPLIQSDTQAITALAIEAARQVQVPFLAIDVGQLQSGEWIVIEVGDAQFSGLSHVSVLELWSKIKDIRFDQEIPTTD
ncbi:MAG: ATP-grasp domain-containing protein [Chloroflexota bacterium]